MSGREDQSTTNQHACMHAGSYYVCIASQLLASIMAPVLVQETPSNAKGKRQKKENKAGPWTEGMAG